MLKPESVAEQTELREVEVPRPEVAADRTRPHIDARTTAWFLEHREKIRSLELESATLRGELETSARVERGAQRFCDRLEKELEKARQREATLARALGYAEAERDQLAQQLGTKPRKKRLRAGSRAD